MVTQLGVSLVVTGILFPIIAACFIGLRFWARSLKGRFGVGIDDWMAVLGWIFACMLSFVAVYGVYHSGFGLPQTEVKGEVQIAFGKVGSGSVSSRNTYLTSVHR